MTTSKTYPESVSLKRYGYWMALVLLPIIVIAGGIAWWFAIRSRRTYVCPSCGQSITVEHMTASNCNVCGAPLQEVQS